MGAVLNHWEQRRRLADIVDSTNEDDLLARFAITKVEIHE